MSFNSSCMMQSFPPAAQVKQPIINILLLFGGDQPPSALDLAKLIMEKLMTYDRFRMGLKSVDGSHEFYELPEQPTVDALIESHIHTQTVSNEKKLLEAVDLLSLQDLHSDNRPRPMWCVHRLINADTGVHGVLFRIHHVIGDGIALIASMSKLFEDDKGVMLDLGIAEKMSGGTSPRAKTKPKTVAEKANNLRATVFDVISSVFRVLGLAVSPYDSDTPFLSPPSRSDMKMSGRRRTVLFPTLKLSFIKSLKDSAGVTVNDVLLSATSGAIRRYCEMQPGGLGQGKGQTVGRALVPVAFPRPAASLKSPSLGMQNLWAFASIAMPLAETTASTRLRATAKATNELKKSTIVGVQMWVQSNLLPLLPAFLQQKTAHDVFSRHTVVFSNLPGPAEAVHMCKQKLISLQVVFPNILPQVLLISYGGEVFFNMCLDDHSVHADELVACYINEMRDLAKALSVPCDDATMFSQKSAGGLFGIVAP